MSNANDVNDWIPVAEAAGLLPSPRRGKKASTLSTVYRWIKAGKLTFRKLGRWTYVSRAEVAALFGPPQRKRQPKPTPATQTREDDAEAERRTEETLRKFGVIP